MDCILWVFLRKFAIIWETMLCCPHWNYKQILNQCFKANLNPTQIAKFMVPIWGPPGSCRPQMGPMLAPWTLLSGYDQHCMYCPQNFQSVNLEFRCTTNFGWQTLCLVKPPNWWLTLHKMDGQKKAQTYRKNRQMWNTFKSKYNLLLRLEFCKF